MDPATPKCFLLPTFLHRTQGLKRNQIPDFLAPYLTMTVVSSVRLIFFHPSNLRDQIFSLSINISFIYSILLTIPMIQWLRPTNLKNTQMCSPSQTVSSCIHLNIINVDILDPDIDVPLVIYLVFGWHRTQIGFRPIRHQVACVCFHRSCHIDVLQLKREKGECFKAIYAPTK